MNKNPKGRPGMKGVIITVYVESPIIRSHERKDPLKRIKPHPFAQRPPTARTRGYDRRAQLLAYARELRDASSQQLQWPKNNSRAKPKKWRWSTSPARLRLSFGGVFEGMKRGWRYERIGSEVDQPCDPKRINGKKTKASKRSNSYICVNHILH
ncbi:hypothetical protein L1049_027023 [Liquidambar formosana]|uniref:Uncharacterized protein n=1 Tax=Liquidambar formosana TaxID=63359 RepID=A0AAP0NFZ9_LIQFO